MKYFILLLLFPIFLFAEVTESYSKKSVQVGEESILEVKFQTGDVSEWNLPTKGFLFTESDTETPIGELREITQTPSELKLYYIYYTTGNFKSNLSWKKPQGEVIQSNEALEVKSVLAGEKEALDIVEPLVFVCISFSKVFLNKKVENIYFLLL